MLLVGAMVFKLVVDLCPLFTFLMIYKSKFPVNSKRTARSCRNTLHEMVITADRIWLHAFLMLHNTEFSCDDDAVKRSKCDDLGLLDLSGPTTVQHTTMDYIKKAKDLAADYADDGILNDSIHTHEIESTAIGVPHLGSQKPVEDIKSTISSAMSSLSGVDPSGYDLSNLSGLAPLFESVKNLSASDLTKAGAAAAPLLSMAGKLMSNGMTADHSGGFDYLTTFKNMAGPGLFAMAAKAGLPNGMKVMPLLLAAKSFMGDHTDLTKLDAHPVKEAAGKDLTHITSKLGSLESVLQQMAPSSFSSLGDLTSLAPALSAVTGGLHMKDLLSAGSAATPLLGTIGNYVTGWMNNNPDKPMDSFMQLRNTFGPALTMLGAKSAGVDMSSLVTSAKGLLEGFVLKG